MKIKRFAQLGALLIAICIMLSTTVITSLAYDTLKVPDIKAVWYLSEGIDSIKKDEKEFSFVSKVNGKEMPFSVTFPVEGGFRIHTDSTGYFEPSATGKIEYTEKDKLITLSAENGTKAEFNYSEAAWEIYAYNAEGKRVYTLSQRQLRFGYSDADLVKIRVDGSISTGEYMTGLGERYSAVKLNGKTYPLWNADNWSKGDYSYVNVPFMHSTKGYSIFINNSYGAQADIGDTISKMYYFSFNGPDMDLYVWAKAPLESIECYTALTGRPFTAPKWSFGYWAGGTGAYWKSENGDGKTEAELVKKVVEGYKKLGTMPVALYGEAVPSNTKSIYDYLKSNNIYMLGWNHPGATWDIKNFNLDILRQLCPGIPDTQLPGIRQKSNPSKFYGDWIWGDYSNPNAGTLIANKMKNAWNWGLKGAMVDYGEYVEEASYFSNGMTGDEMHNIYAYFYNKATYEAWKERMQDDNFILFARAGYAGSQHYAASFGGDQESTYEGLMQAIKGAISISASGYSVWGSDIGGLGGVPSDELYLRWLQFATFSPLMRAHGNNRNPWVHGEAAEKNFTEMYWLRENLIDLLYSANIQSGKNGKPMMQSMALAFPDETELTDEMQYMLCNELLVCPIYTSNAYKREVIFPDDTWISLWDNTEIKGGEKIEIEAPYNRIPVYIRSGSVMPVQVSSKTLSLIDSSADGRTEALVVTPANSKRELNYWKDSSTEVKFTSEKTAPGAYKVTSSGSGNAKVIIAYATSAKSVSVDGTALKELNSPPVDGEVGYYVDKMNNRTTVGLESDRWSEISIENGAGTYKNLAEGKEIVCNVKGGKPQNVLDGSVKTTWAVSNRIGTEAYIDLGESKKINEIVLKWATNHASSYTLEYSNDSENPQNWLPVKKVENSFGGTENINFDTAEARYVKISNVEKAQNANPELYEIEIYGDEVEIPSYETDGGENSKNEDKASQNEIKNPSAVAVFWVSFVALVIVAATVVILTAVIKNKKELKKNS